jgi:hypothetical protein
VTLSPGIILICSPAASSVVDFPHPSARNESNDPETTGNHIAATKHGSARRFRAHLARLARVSGVLILVIAVHEGVTAAAHRSEAAALSYADRKVDRDWPARPRARMLAACHTALA